MEFKKSDFVFLESFKLANNMNREIKYLTLDNWDGSKSIKQHAFIEINKGNISLCGRITALSEGGRNTNFSEIISENISDKCCKKCLYIKNIKTLK